MVGFFRETRASFGSGRSRFSGGFGGRRGFNRGFRRETHKAICADCQKECEVPFKPRGDRPVYCLDCFKKRKGISSEMPKKEASEEIAGNEEIEESEKIAESEELVESEEVRETPVEEGKEEASEEENLA